jgi:hypothetical protein
MGKQKGINDFGKQGWLIIIYVLFLFWFSADPVDLLNVSVDANIVRKYFGMSAETIKFLSNKTIGRRS